MTKTVTRLAALGLMLAIALTPLAKASEINKKTVITTHQTIQIHGKVLEPGRYVIKLFDSQTDRDVLQVYNASETKIEMTILAHPAYRTKSTDDSSFTFWEMQNAQPPALRTWFYPGDNWGLAFSEVH
jgi:hypothetical protein